MKWLTHYEDDNWKIEITGTKDSEFNYYFYQWEKSFIRITAKNITVSQKIIVDNLTEYMFYSNGEQSTIEITDEVRAFENYQYQIDAEIIDDITGLPVIDNIDYIEFYTVKGERQTADNLEVIPDFIPYHNINQNLVPDSKINTTSNLYGFGTRTLYLQDIDYTLTVNGNAFNALNGKKLRVFIYNNELSFSRWVDITEKYDISKSITFVCPEPAIYTIKSFYDDETSPRDGNVTVNWYKLEAGKKSTAWCPKIYEEGYTPFYLQYSEKLLLVNRLNSNSDLTYSLRAAELDINQFVQDFYIKNYVSGFVYQFITPDCPSEMVQIEWVGRFGVRKSWLFKVDRLIHNSDKQLNLQTLDNNFHTLKNKRQSLLVSHKNADYKTQTYLSDIVLSDEVYMYIDDEKLRVKIDTNSIEVTQKQKDVQLLINKTAYDTI